MSTRSKLKALLTVILSSGVLIATSAKAERVFHCHSEMATGFFKENGDWREGNFKNKKFTIRFSDDYTKVYGLKLGGFKCSVPYPEQAPDTIACLAGYGRAFLFEKKKFRFTFSAMNATGFLENGSDTDVFYAGACEKF